MVSAFGALVAAEVGGIVRERVATRTVAGSRSGVGARGEYNRDGVYMVVVWLLVILG